MGVTRNVQRGEGILRVIIGAILFVLGFFLTGLLKPVSVVVGGLLVLTAIVGY